MATLSTADVAIGAIQSAFADGSEFEASSLIAVGIIAVVMLTGALVMAIVAYNAQALKSGQGRIDDASDVIKRVVFALIFFVVILSFIGVFYAF